MDSNQHFLAIVVPHLIFFFIIVKILRNFPIVIVLQEELLKKNIVKVIVDFYPVFVIFRRLPYNDISFLFDRNFRRICCRNWRCSRNVNIIKVNSKIIKKNNFYRSVPPHTRSPALGLQGFLVSLLGNTLFFKFFYC